MWFLLFVLDLLLDPLLVQEEDHLLVQEEDHLIVQGEDHLLVQDEGLLLVQEEDLLLAQEEDLLLVQEDDLLAVPTTVLALKPIASILLFYPMDLYVETKEANPSVWLVWVVDPMAGWVAVLARKFG